MRQNIPYENHSKAILDLHDQAVVVPFDVKNRIAFYRIGAWIRAAYFLKVLPFGVLGDADTMSPVAPPDRRAFRSLPSAASGS